MSARALRGWKDLAQENVLPGPRPRSLRELRRDQWLVARAWHLLGLRTGEDALCRVLENDVSRRRVREVLRGLKVRRRKIDRRLAEERCVHVTVHVRDAVWGQDATHLGRCAPGGEPVQGEVIKEAASTRLLDVQVGPPATGEEIVAMLDALRVQRGLPLVYSTDNGIYCCTLVEDYLRAHKVVHLRNLPRTPQHNAAVERAIGELKLESCLGRGVLLHDADEARARIDRARCKLDQHLPRASRGWRTAVQLDEILPHWHPQVDRESFWREACAAIERETMGATNKRDRRMRERRAIFGTLEHFALVTRTRGGVPQSAVTPEVIS